MAPEPTSRPTIAQAGEGTPLDFGPEGIATVMLGGARTAGKLSLIMTPIEPGSGPPLHVHEHDDELFIVIDGNISYFVDREWTTVGPGGIAYFPKGTPHCYFNAGTTVGHHWILTTPSGFEDFFAELAEESRRPGGPSVQQYLRINAEHGYTILGDLPDHPNETTV